MLDFKLFGPLSPQVISTLIVVTVLSVFFIIVGGRIGKLKATETPKGIVFVTLMFVEQVIKLINEHLEGKKLKIFGPYLFSILIYLAVANTISLFGLRAPLSNAGVALAFSIITLFWLRFADIRFKGIKKKLHDVFIGYVWWMFPIMVPINLIGEVSTPLTMGIRLFGNLVSGTVISAMVYAALNFVAGIFAGVFLHAIFDIFFGLIQAFVFFMLSVVNISMATDA
ncbi:MAG: F0F1 ATP synthase subunit A [Bacilli bacterium]|nr:F0F1 ATP synthase subunit A [Bacilli bacterium]MBN2696677.1 F0F1 ATP synthase subunit A [Bacilli bacterium]